LFDPAKKFVRVTHLRADGFIEFDFSLGEEEMYVELILPAQAFDDFCALNKVVFLDESTRLRLDEADPTRCRLSSVTAKTIIKTDGKNRN